MCCNESLLYTSCSSSLLFYLFVDSEIKLMSNHMKMYSIEKENNKK